MARAIKIGTDNTVTVVDIDLLNIPAIFDKQPQMIRTGRVSEGYDRVTVGNLTEVRPIVLAQETRHEETRDHNELATRLVVPKVDRFHGSVRGDAYIVGEGNIDLFDTQLTGLPEFVTVEDIETQIERYEDL